jgi:hypothetical protein
MGPTQPPPPIPSPLPPRRRDRSAHRSPFETAEKRSVFLPWPILLPWPFGARHVDAEAGDPQPDRPG